MRIYFINRKNIVEAEKAPQLRTVPSGNGIARNQAGGVIQVRAYWQNAISPALQVEFGDQYDLNNFYTVCADADTPGYGTAGYTVQAKNPKTGEWCTVAGFGSE